MSPTATAAAPPRRSWPCRRRDRLAGQIAKRQAITNPQNTVFAVKRLIGRKFDDPNVQRACDLLPYALAEAPNGDVKVRVRDRQYSPEELSSFLLRELKSFAEEALGEEVTEAIVTVPAYFDDSQRRRRRMWAGSRGRRCLDFNDDRRGATYGLDSRARR